ncbi:hypothetical protein DFQ28_002506 [Apophysomyces sp. BC1034]|nr:hypothetical protein DFQ30_001231 [Apophysomyces sp. BC1015]KAG0175520.1 hypothetical protein DFQ29_007130 [Apophysomyces sp. BC1021]KAG0190094.1 hypothetical protein DFQ28_002506 [Apophysomyces sp. BC1034]
MTEPAFIVPKLLYISLYTVFGSAIPYLNLFYDEALHLSSQQIGVLLAIAPFVQSVACPLWTILADKRPTWHGPLMATLTFLGGLAATSGYMDPSPIWKTNGEDKGLNILAVGLLIDFCGINMAFYVFAAGVTMFVSISLFMHLGTGDISEHMTIPEEDEREPLLHKPTNYAIPGQPNMTTAAAAATSAPLSSSFRSALSHVPTNGSNAEESMVPRRDSLATHHLYPFYTNSVHEYDSNLPMLKETTSIAALDVQMEANDLLSHLDHMPSLGLVLSNIPSIDTSLAVFGVIGQPETQTPERSTLGTRRVWTFLLTMMFFGVGYSMVAQFLFLYLRNDLGMQSNMIGWTGPLGGIAEVSTFYVSRQLFERFSVTSLISFAHLAIVFRNLIYTLLVPGQWWCNIVALSMQMINGLSYAMVWATAVSEVDTFFPPEQRAMAQGVLAALFTGLGYGLGCIIGGLVYQQSGSKMLLEVSCGICTLSFCVFLFGRLQ